jgi:quercetin dioxygenase-like cupin family protein
MAEHVVKKVSDLDYQTPPEIVGRSSGYSGNNVVDGAGGAVQMGFRVARLEPGGSVDSHVHSWEESLYVTAGSLTVDTPEGSVELVIGDYGLPAGRIHPCSQEHLRRACVVLGDEGAAPAGTLRLRHSISPAGRRRDRPGGRRS